MLKRDLLLPRQRSKHVRSPASARLSRRESLALILGSLVYAQAIRSRPVAEKRPIALITIPYDSGGTAQGTARAPAVLRKHGLLERLREVADVADYGEMPVTPSGPTRDPASGLIGLGTLFKMLDDLEPLVERALEAGQFAVLVGGDCPILLAGLAAIRRQQKIAGLVFVDGHEDAYAPHESPSGESADMEYGFAVGLKTEDWVPALTARFPLMRRRDALLLAHRDLGVIKQDRATSVLGEVPHYGAEQVAADPKVVVNEGLAALSSDVSAVWLHTDVDALSTRAMPAVDYQLSGGLTWTELSAVVAASLADPRAVGWDITIYNPDLDPGERLAPRIVEYIVEGIRARGAAMK
jgi:arginase